MTHTAGSLRTLALLVLFALASACSLDRSGLGGRPDGGDIDASVRDASIDTGPPGPRDADVEIDAEVDGGETDAGEVDAGPCPRGCPEGAECIDDTCVCPTGMCCPGCSGTDVCHAGACRPCGTHEVPCCATGPACVDGADVCIDGICQTAPPCGGAGESCCESMSCDSGLMCNGEGVCALPAMEGECGGAGEACCEGGTCDNILLGCAGGTCSYCGGPGQVCCGLTRCRTGLSCNWGICR